MIFDETEGGLLMVFKTKKSIKHIKNEISKLKQKRAFAKNRELAEIFDNQMEDMFHEIERRKDNELFNM